MKGGNPPNDKIEVIKFNLIKEEVINK